MQGVNNNENMNILLPREAQGGVNNERVDTIEPILPIIIEGQDEVIDFVELGEGDLINERVDIIEPINQIINQEDQDSEVIDLVEQIEIDQGDIINEWVDIEPIQPIIIEGQVEVIDFVELREIDQGDRINEGVDMIESINDEPTIILEEVQPELLKQNQDQKKCLVDETLAWENPEYFTELGRSTDCVNELGRTTDYFTELVMKAKFIHHGQDIIVQEQGEYEREQYD